MLSVNILALISDNFFGSGDLILRGRGGGTSFNIREKRLHDQSQGCPIILGIGFRLAYSRFLFCTWRLSMQAKQGSLLASQLALLAGPFEPDNL